MSTWILVKKIIYFDININIFFNNFINYMVIDIEKYLSKEKKNIVNIYELKKYYNVMYVGIIFVI